MRYAQVGKSLGLPTHCYLGASDAKIVDAQAGLESGMTAMIGALAGINMISGAGMLDFLACQSPEKLVVDAEGDRHGKAPASRFECVHDPCHRLLRGHQLQGRLPQAKNHPKLFSNEQYLPSPVIDRDSVRGWQAAGSLDTFARAKDRTKHLLTEYKRPEMDTGQEKELTVGLHKLASTAGMEKLPEV